ncbi:MAG: Spx/MgsR family RNA polymerase-binding regulatory protein [Streptococcaceae bacterium]|jgi:Spx/MgsR family transcriptional regulator|nr:Spx/MgsR family RNA polymerase-binding regulatory protein [Streptococcaceae bacterium]
MELTFYYYPICSTCKKAKAHLEEKSVINLIDIKKAPPSKEQILTWMQEGDFTIKNFFNTSGNSYRTLGLKETIDQMSQEEAAQLLANDGMLIKRPLLVSKTGQLLAIGYKTQRYDEVLTYE